MTHTLLDTPVTPNWEGLIRCLKREGTPDRTYVMELFLDVEIQDAICERFELDRDLNKNDPHYADRRYIAIQRFLGYDYARCGLNGMEMVFNDQTVEDTAENKRSKGRVYQDLHKGPITTWEEFEKYPWPDPEAATTESIEWFEKNLPDDMCLVAHAGHFAEYLSWLMGYETLCYTLFDDRKLVAAIAQKVMDIDRVVVRRLLEFDRIQMIWGSDDMGFRTGTLISPDDLREFVFPGHRMLVQQVHDAGKLYLLHSCGNLKSIMDELIDDVKIDAKHSFEDTIEDVRDAKKTYGDRVSFIGGIDVDFLCRSDEEAIRARVRNTLEVCQPGGGYCLGTGNSVANYIPVENYLIMLDEGRRFGN